jgi:hypothetical protein
MREMVTQSRMWCRRGMLRPIAHGGLDEGAELGDGVIPGSIWRSVPALMAEAGLPVPLQGRQPVDQPAVGAPAARRRDVLGPKPGEEGLQVGVPLGELASWAALKVPGGRSWRGGTRGSRHGAPQRPVEGGRGPHPVGWMCADQGWGVKRGQVCRQPSSRRLG